MSSAFILAVLLLAVPAQHAESRALHDPSDAMQFMEKFLAHYSDLMTLDDLENIGSSPMEEPQLFDSGLEVTEYPKWIEIPAENDNAWIHLLRRAIASQKRAPPDRAKRGWNRGCFGLKLDRIGSLSGLGC
ncbi:C-type natriuretic peptide-like [Brienomyrus brachyistius]|uniref:C-type natriuretic peptide-like n=1 Tax=Brienomyrus brachyistius TaxID=42636 RepID=UPI0020B2D4BF|nr:C-type natriuretic peptide-like [Brienomyrus brachyistius]